MESQAAVTIIANKEIQLKKVIVGEIEHEGASIEGVTG